MTFDKIARFSFQIALHSLVKQKENLTLHQKSPRVLFRALLQLKFAEGWGLGHPSQQKLPYNYVGEVWIIFLGQCNIISELLKIEN